MITLRSILLNNNYSKQLLAIILFVFGFNLHAVPVLAAGVEPQEVKVRLFIDDGNRDGAKVTIERDGKVWKSKEGAAQQGFQLEYGHEFVFIFSKPGYITKKVLFSTVVPKNMLKDGFDPYFFDVTIFKQYSDVNLVLFTQPVGKIIYKEDIDGFGYDTDYNKVVLSEQKAEEDKIKKIKEDEKITGIPAKTIGAPPASGGKDENANQRATEGDPGKDELVNNKASEGQLNNNKNLGGVVQGNGKGTLAGQTGTEQRGTGLIGVTEKDPRDSGLGSVTQGEDRNTNGSGSEKRTRDEQSFDEGNRTITQVTIILNGQVTIYKRIVYKWGGVYFFQDGINITESAFNSEAM